MNRTPASPVWRYRSGSQPLSRQSERHARKDIDPPLVRRWPTMSGLAALRPLHARLSAKLIVEAPAPARSFLLIHDQISPSEQKYIDRHQGNPQRRIENIKH